MIVPTTSTNYKPHYLNLSHCLYLAVSYMKYKGWKTISDWIIWGLRCIPLLKTEFPLQSCLVLEHSLNQRIIIKQSNVMPCCINLRKLKAKGERKEMVEDTSRIKYISNFSLASDGHAIDHLQLISCMWPSRFIMSTIRIQTVKDMCQRCRQLAINTTTIHLNQA